MNSVFIVWHTHEVNADTDEKLIGVYANRADAEAAILRLSDKPGFKDASDGFEISEYILGKDHWTDGYVSQLEALQVTEK